MVNTNAAPAQLQRKRKSAALHRCRFPDWSPSAITAITLSPPTFDTELLAFGGKSAERGVLGVARANGDVELMCWGGHQGWIAWRTLPSSFPLPKHRNSKKPTSLLSHLLFTHQTTLSDSDVILYDGDLAGAEQEIQRLSREGVRLFGVGGVGSELVEWEWGGPGAGKEVGRVKSTLPTLPPIFALAASRSSSCLAIGCEDSSIRILNIMDDELELISRIEVGGPGKVRALSLAWGNPVAAPQETASKGKEREDSPDSQSSLPARFATPREGSLIAGCSNSSIRIYNPSSSGLSGNWSSAHRMTLDQLKGEQTVVWTIAVLGDGTIVSGDSMGNVKFWDSAMGTQMQSFRGHKADVLCLAIGSDGTSVFTSGIDQKTVEFRLVSVARNSKSSIGSASQSRWIQSSGRRLHCHDVRSMIVSPPYLLPLPFPSETKQPTQSLTPLLTSGGLDLNLIVVCCSPAPPSTSTSITHNPVSESISTEFESTTHRRASYVPQRSRPMNAVGGGQTVGGRESRLLVLRRERSVGIWGLDDPKSGSLSSAKRDDGWSKRKERFGIVDEIEEQGDADKEEASGWHKLLEMDLKLQTNLISSATSNDGRWLAVSDLFETKLFKLQFKNGELVPRRQKSFSTFLSAALPPSLGTGSSCLTFTKDSTRLIIATSFGSNIAVVELPSVLREDLLVSVVWGQHGDRDSGREIRGRVSGSNKSNRDVSMNGDGAEDSDEEDVEMEDAPRTSSLQAREKPATIVALAASSDGHWLASADLERKVCVFDLASLRHHTTLPTPSEVPTSLSFLPTSTTLEPTLLLGLPTNALSLFGLNSLRFHSWSLPLSSLQHNTMMDIREPLIGVLFEPREEVSSASLVKVHESRRSTLVPDAEVAVVWGGNWVARINLDELRKESVQNGNGKAVGGIRREADKKRAREEEIGFVPDGDKTKAEGKLDVKITRRYQPLVLLEFVGSEEIVAVEKTWFDLAQGLPEAWVKSGEFGT